MNGQENLYRIAIQYYGSGSPENVEKIRRANGLSGNNIETVNKSLFHNITI
ncbi:elastin binding protein ebpS [Staphylococcus aureus]|uniref:Elastin binding protein ebpS n=1 Tax=Staphylococcus aureus TaxID=1280 RepID=A0A380E1N0_STAAU|nr:elastin binding protein ebpS [Staphylococcus aureus]